jgi:hypothetical protein
MFISLQVQNRLRWYATAIGMIIMILLPDAPLVTSKGGITMQDRTGKVQEMSISLAIH